MPKMNWKEEQGMKKVAVVGSFVVDLMARTPHLPEPGETVMGSYFKAGPGGKGANQAAAAKRAGSELVFSTKIGTDSFAEIARDSFKANGIPLEYVFENSQVPTGAALISVDEITSQNEIVVVLGACSTFTDEDIKKLEEALKDCEYLLLQMEINPDATEKLIRLANKIGIKVILNTAPVQKLTEELYPLLELVTPNEVEAKILTGIACDDTEGCRKAAQAFFEKGVKQVIITIGKRGVYYNDGKREEIISNYDVPVVDTTGAGDAFNGGLLAGLSQGMDLLSAARYGNVVSNLAVTKMGTATAMPSKKEIQEFIKNHKVEL